MGQFETKEGTVYYQVLGTGLPLLLIHGNSVSSKLFSSVEKSLSEQYQLILFDFPGHGKSSRLDSFTTDFWFYNSEIALQLLQHLGLEDVVVVGTSGGALVGINLALEHPEVVQYLVADSFEGDTPDPDWTKGLREERSRAKQDISAQDFWFDNHGADWEKVVDQDTEVILSHLESGKGFFHRDISELSVPTLLTGSNCDEYIDSIEERYTRMAKRNSRIQVKIFETGNHPAMLSNKSEFFELLNQVLKT